MEHYDPEKAARVWQRVQAQPSQPREPEPLCALIAAENQAATVFEALARRTGKDALCRRMAQECRRHSAWLKGICRLTDCDRPVSAGAAPAREPLAVTLRKSYGSCLRTAAACDSRRDDPEYGHAFAAMAEKKREHCRILLKLLGAEPKANHRKFR